MPRHGVTLTPARSARLAPPRRRQSPQPVLALARDVSGVSARQPEGMGVQTKTFLELKAFKGNGVSLRLTLARAVTSIVSGPDTSSSASLNMDSSFATSNTVVRRAGDRILERKLCVENLIFLSSVSPSPFPLFYSLSLCLVRCARGRGLMFTLARVLV